MRTFATTFDPRRNSFDVLRLVLAATVALTHASALGYGWQPRFPSGLALGTLGVDGFFVLSGFLVARSFVNLESFPRFAWHRLLRIMPGFWVCLLITALLFAPIAALLVGRDVLSIYSGEESAISYLTANSALPITQSGISGLLDSTPAGGSFNGALWSLAFEAVCYALVASLGVLAVLRHRRWLVLCIGAVLTALTLAKVLGMPVPLVGALLLELTLLFVLGMLGYLYADRIPVHGSLAVLAAGVFALCAITLQDYRVGGALAFAYLLLWCGICSPLHVRLSADLSYGVYIYHWPVLQLLTLGGLAVLSPMIFLAAGFLLTVGFGAASWYLVERPALGQRHSAVPDRVAALAGRCRRAVPRMRDKRTTHNLRPTRARRRKGTAKK